MDQIKMHKSMREQEKRSRLLEDQKLLQYTKNEEKTIRLEKLKRI